jgi:putative intracellular protease/amidase
MKRFLLALITFGTVLLPSILFAETTRQILMIAREVSEDMEFMIKNEVQPMLNQIREGGYSIIIATESGKELTAHAQRLVPDLRLDDVKIADYCGVIVPCMMVGYLKDSVPKAAVELIKQAYEADLPIAAQNSNELLTPAGLTKAKKVAYSAGVVVDGNLITSWNCPATALDNKKPIDTEKLVAEFLNAVERYRDAR